jgi:hypothetical protein
MAPPILQQLDTLERDLRSMRIEFERFFAGGADVAPESLVLELARRIRDLRLLTHGVAEGFRLTTLEAQFNSYREMFQRRLRSREIGAETSHLPQRAADEPPPPERVVIDPRQGIVVRERVPSEVAEALHRELCQGNSKLGKVDATTLLGFLERQAADLRARTGCSSVRFRLVQEEGELRLKAKPVGAGG